MNPSPEITELIKDLVTEIKSKDINQKNLKRAGTDLEQNMDFNYGQKLEQKFIQLRQELNIFNSNPSNLFSLNDLYNFFVSKNPAVKKEEIQSLFELTDIKESKITLNKFIYKYLLLEEKLKLKKEDLILVKNQLIKNLEDDQEKLREYENEEYGANGISLQNDLNITIIEIKNLTGIKKCKVTLRLLDQYNKTVDEKETEEVAGPNPKFNEAFSFQVDNFEYKVMGILNETDSLINEGQSYFVIELPKLLNQLKQNLCLNVQGEENKAKVYLTCSFIYNHTKKYTDLIQKTSQQIDKLKQTIFIMENIIEKTDEPFGLLYNNKIKEIKDKKILNKSEDVDDYLGSSRISVYSNVRNSNLNNSESPIKNRFSSNYDDITNNRNRVDDLDIINEERGEGFNSKFLGNEIQSTEGFLPDNYNKLFPKNSSLGKKNTQLIIFGICITLMNFILGKFDVFNLLLYIFGLIMIYNVSSINERFHTRRYFFYALLAVIAFDFFWIMFLNSDQNIQTSFWRYIIFVLTILSLIIKLMISYYIYKRNNNRRS